ncbi:hypothetical protein H4Q26_010375 [Puccinia striiformis f. sp. tritici PST-130]|nr:hypothetical protein H4Q26_010375 [Puccinia striiformis f. sp. tritici PST-130]
MANLYGSRTQETGTRTVDQTENKTQLEFRIGTELIKIKIYTTTTRNLTPPWRSRQMSKPHTPITTAMADLQKQYEELMKLVTKERALQKKAEEALAVAKQATELAAATAADNIAKANAFAVQVSAAAIQKGPKMGLPDRFSGS